MSYHVAPYDAGPRTISYLQSLHDSGFLFHPDDRGADIVMDNTYERVLSPKEATLYDARMQEVFDQIDDPYEVCLDIMGI